MVGGGALVVVVWDEVVVVWDDVVDVVLEAVEEDAPVLVVDVVDEVAETTTVKEVSQ